MGQTLATMRGWWHVCVALHWFRRELPNLAVMKRSKIRRIYRRSCGVLMDRYYQSFIRLFSSCIVRLVTCISPSASITGRVIASFSLLLRPHEPGIFAGWHNIELFTILPSHRSSHSIKTPGLWRELEGPRFLRYNASGFCILLRLHS